MIHDDTPLLAHDFKTALGSKVCASNTHTHTRHMHKHESATKPKQPFAVCARTYSDSKRKPHMIVANINGTRYTNETTVNAVAYGNMFINFFCLVSSYFFSVPLRFIIFFFFAIHLIPKYNRFSVFFLLPEIYYSFYYYFVCL